MPTVKVALYTPEPFLISGLRSELAGVEDIELSAACSSIPSLLHDVTAQHPDVVLLQLTAEVTIGTLQSLTAKAGDAAIVLWVRTVNSEFASRARVLGVRGILNCCLPLEVQLNCLRRVAAGESWAESSQMPKPRFDRKSRLTPREREIAGLVVCGMKNKEVAEATGLTVGTVKVYLTRIFEKLAVRGRFDLAFLGFDDVKGITAKRTVDLSDALRLEDPLGNWHR